ncbi:30S ribosomal protein S17 [Coxiella burnetii]|uniref:Small ribosomal subunit protein uS17 n=2 Tax=Coxiella burnetii TaxID=777 RepID=RS17_COXBR|nr:RecName: Full=Small ribosomal subunit protein uS17; AltName: Full=30S ribosomal protein S17 [Coxiella burnetii RSA 331]AIT62749.1 30S ribosomal protein S17 [Coxiella burnetii str. Namibia]AML47815.1 30S ribosomal protein S17 [Coxiella burnetii]ATN85566.1 30S ribosomal protein S17 [Coxiella burnetii str. Schperling]EAX31819.1 30S ribosomal protein S17 [Coxiella burnetii 'MSU Goat Q177']EDR35030.1 ribosomal protein S17 [Coxiella burnetii Q321]
MNKNEKMVRSLMGTVVSNKMNDTVVVRVERRVKHPKYGKFIKRSTKIHAHDKGNECQIGDIVTIRECRPISKTKSWTLVKINERAEKVE